MTQSLTGKVALVTGGSRGIGAAIVRRLSREGAAVAFTYAASTDRAEALAADLASSGASVAALKADSADPVAVREAVQATVERFGRLDILVNNAGILVSGNVEDIALSDFDRQFAVNIRAVFVAAQEAARHMREGGRIISVGSVGAERSGFPGTTVYSMTKAAVASLTRGLARDLGPRGITVNTIQPGPVASEMSAGMETMLIPLIALGRMGQDTEIAALAAFLSGPEAGFITGAALTADGSYLA
ncbi:3-oxoacyl-ACP reductase family protein [Methylobacterium frigidaeris]|uniref:Cyclic-di-GMP-binding biofilm dispersal mediator protein n=1 Tax=Methylobacterium frigidaeris TaxID=2038277 RepID=A0AA37HIN8_9HYPH|nr:3-oxoacyl-ACP reductase family protein [Methylobacterium frigidaeris]PIK71428.1 oxidoreductase [Methylobacterium frigidaeris]GJD66512.1 Cyclic-di-GMP-binding biofilm dispersal mediator protein [Methylobacterium frigidaeris]